MDAVKFIEERDRMCESFEKCSYGCPAWDGSCKLETGTYLKCEADEKVKIVEECLPRTHARRGRACFWGSGRRRKLTNLVT